MTVESIACNVGAVSDLTEYERKGDINAPFAINKGQERRQAERESWRASRCTVPALTWEAYVAGEPCPGCGRPYRDAEPWESKGTMYFTDDERTRYEAEEARYKAAHGNCHAHRHGVSGSLTMHCGRCCPPPPMSGEQIERISSVFSRIQKTPDYELMRWRLRLYCGHVVERRAHHTHKTVHAAFTGGHGACPECGLDPATIIDAEAVGLAGDPPRPAAAAQPKPPKPTRAQLEARVRELESELESLRGDG